MNANLNSSKVNSPELHLAFDVGHSSIGWAVLQQPTVPTALPDILGTGVVTFGANDCLAVKRRQNRQARRHTRATRQRIARMELLLRQLGVLTPEQIAASHRQAGGDSFAWQRAAAILTAARAGKPLPQTGWPELWDILRWYAHNRGYFAPPWANREEEVAPEPGELSDEDKRKNARDLMGRFGKPTMAEAINAYAGRDGEYEQEVVRWTAGQRSDKPKHFKGLQAAFEREIVWDEVLKVLTALKGTLPKLDDALIRALLGNDVDPLNDPLGWQTIPCPGLKLPKRYHGGLLFGQMIPRFDNRIIGVCPIHFARRQAELLAAGFSQTDASHQAAKECKLPAKASPEFLRFRWAMQLANVFGAAPGERGTSALPVAARQKLTALAARHGSFTKGEFKKAVREAAGWPEKHGRDNLDNLLLHPDAEEALIFDPVQAALHKSDLSAAFATLPDQFAKRLRGKLARGQSLTPAQVRSWLTGDDATAFDAEVQRVLDAANTRKGRKQAAATPEQLLAEKLTAKFPSGRAPYARPVLRHAFEEVMKGWDPRAEKNALQPRGCLCQTNELKEAQLHRRLDEQTNNHLIRHRLLILGGEPPKPGATAEDERRRFKGLLHDIIKGFAGGDMSRIASLTIEVNRDIRDLSGKTRKEQEQDLGLRLGDFKRVAVKVEEACRRRHIPITAGLIRKARVAEDLGWKCPYTRKDFSIDTLLDGVMDKDHVIPHSDRQSDSLDSLVMTWKEVNLWKRKRTAMEFIRDDGGKQVPGRPELTIMPLTAFEAHVNSLKPKGGQGHPDDRARKKRRVQRLLTEHYEEKEFTPRDLTVTSHLVRLGAQVLQRAFPPEQRPPVVSLPGSVTGEVRKAWKLIGCLADANPAIMEEVEERDEQTGEIKRVRRAKKKDDIRGITHLHHALDACVLGLAALYFPRHGSVWSAMVKAGADREADDDRRLWLAMTKRRPNAGEAALLRTTGLYQADSEGRLHLADLPSALKEQIRQRLAEKRVVQHIPADMSGVKVQDNTRGVVGVDAATGRVLLRQRSSRDPETGLQSVKTTDEAPGKLLGFDPPGGVGKLKRQKGVRVITDNFGVAILDHAPDGAEKFVVIPWHRVWWRVFEKSNPESLLHQNGGNRPRLLRNGQTISIAAGTYAGRWRVFSVKAKQAGIKVNLGTLDCLGVEEDYLDPETGKKRTRTATGCKLDAALPTMVKGGLEILSNSLCSVR